MIHACLVLHVYLASTAVWITCFCFIQSLCWVLLEAQIIGCLYPCSVDHELYSLCDASDIGEQYRTCFLGRFLFLKLKRINFFLGFTGIMYLFLSIIQKSSQLKYYFYILFYLGYCSVVIFVSDSVGLISNWTFRQLKNNLYLWICHSIGILKPWLRYFDHKHSDNLTIFMQVCAGIPGPQWGRGWGVSLGRRIRGRVVPLSRAVLLRTEIIETTQTSKTELDACISNR